MPSFTEWLSQRNKNTFNELFEPNIQGVDPETRTKSWLITKGPKHSLVDDDQKMISIKDFLRTSESKLGCEMVMLSTQGNAFLRREDISLMEKVDKIGRALGVYFQKIDHNYNGLLAFEPFSQDEREKNVYMKAINSIATKYNLTGRLIGNGKRLIVYSEKGKLNYPHLFSNKQINDEI